MNLDEEIRHLVGLREHADELAIASWGSPVYRSDIGSGQGLDDTLSGEGTVVSFRATTLQISYCSAAFTSLCGPSSSLHSFGDLLVDDGKFMQWHTNLVNTFVYAGESSAPPVEYGTVRLRSPYTVSGGHEFTATCTLSLKGTGFVECDESGEEVCDIITHAVLTDIVSHKTTHRRERAGRRRRKDRRSGSCHSSSSSSSHGSSEYARDRSAAVSATVYGVGQGPLVCSV
eukprot:gnl/TRDRNA2_/TRDRNA2_150703_c1_seq1.p1 gnl/TRDRNA2_/TRDRNA2_150703_c1~~gnl/TRDRNA2_/TRDRNA2_150703_c1_seq1.p1  ORF type:complete len:243 (-),score=16.63 gnl/TRDRNA2_/TRDRNA2_150703_c1_seq1:275-964(-)